MTCGLETQGLLPPSRYSQFAWNFGYNPFGLIKILAAPSRPAGKCVAIVQSNVQNGFSVCSGRHSLATYCVRGTASGYTAKHGKTQEDPYRQVSRAPPYRSCPQSPLKEQDANSSEQRQSSARLPPPSPAWGPGWQVPGLALPPSTELLDRLRAGQGIAVAVVHLNAVIANTHGVGRHDPWVQDKERACEPHVSTLETTDGPCDLTAQSPASWFKPGIMIITSLQDWGTTR